MVQTAIIQTIKTLNDVHTKFNLRRTEDEQFWVVVLEAKHSDLTIELAIPQALAYMMANRQGDQPVYGMVTNGGTFAFLKLSQQAFPEYDISDVFSLLPRRNQLYDLLQILKRVAEVLQD